MAEVWLKRGVRAVTPAPLYEMAHRLKCWAYGRLQETEDQPAAASSPPPPQSYQEIHASRAAALLDALDGRKVLVVGANTGGDCRLFIEMGAVEVHGLDVIDEIGCDYAHPRVTYHKAGIENCGLPDDAFDLVFAVATMEHVRGLEAGFEAMARLVRQGGAVYSVASPLWNSAGGHHMGCFAEHPWVHLLYARDDLVAYAHRQGIDGERGHSIEFIIDYMLNPLHFNRRPAADYIAACTALADRLEITENSLAMDPADRLDHPLGQEALSRGFPAEELLAVTHVFVARKPV